MFAFFRRTKPARTTTRQRAASEKPRLEVLEDRCLPSGGCISPPPGLVSWWPGDGNANDIAGTNNGTLLNGATFAPGEVAQAFSFDGADDQVRVPNDVSLEPARVTVEAWVRATNPGRFRYIVEKGAPD